MAEPKSWEELVDKPGEEAKRIIELEDPTLKVIVMNVNSPMTRDYRINRVRILVNDEGKVDRPPTKG